MALDPEGKRWLNIYLTFQLQGKKDPPVVRVKFGILSYQSAAMQDDPLGFFNWACNKVFFLF